MVRLGLAALPEQELEALRQLFCRIALNWLQNLDYKPLGALPPEKDDAGLSFGYRQGITQDIFVILILLRTDPVEVLDVFFSSERGEIWSVFQQFCAHGSSFFDDNSYYALYDDKEEAAMREAVAALHRRTRAEVFRLIDRPFLLQKWMAASQADSDLADDLADLEALYDVYHIGQTDEEKAADDQLMRIGFKLDPPPSPERHR